MSRSQYMPTAGRSPSLSSGDPYVDPASPSPHNTTIEYEDSNPSASSSYDHTSSLYQADVAPDPQSHARRRAGPNDPSTSGHFDQQTSGSPGAWGGPGGGAGGVGGHEGAFASGGSSSLNPFAGGPRPRSSFNSSDGSLAPPLAPFAGSPSRPRSINYLPTKFSTLHKQGDWAHRRSKQGGGRAAFSRDEARMGEDDSLEGKGKKKKLVWNRFKWMIFATNTALMGYSLAGLICLLLVWFNVWTHADIIRTGNHRPLIVSTVACSLGVFTAIIGYAGILLNNRPFLAVYSVLVWACFALTVAPGYITYKMYEFNLEGKINKQWSRDLGEMGRLRIQNQLKCCGYFSPYVEATVSNTCYARSILPGCKGRYWRFEKSALKAWFTVSFALVPVNLIIIVISLLSSNHVTYRFGKGLTPKQYRLDLGSLAYIMDGYAGEIAAAYGPGLAAEALHRSSSNLELLQQSNHAGRRRSSFFGSSSATSSKIELAGSEYNMSGLRADGSSDDSRK